MIVSGDWINRHDTQVVCALLTEAGHRAMFVGGCVRNSIIGMPVTDIDIATDAMPATVMHLAEAAGLKVVPTGIDHGTVTVVADGLPHEVTTFRRDVETDGRRAVVAYSTDIREDAMRRDFTMNALYATPDGQVVDPIGGLPDLLARRVRFVGDAETRIREDYLRILRFFRFHAWYGDTEAGLDAEGLAACAALAAGLDSLSRERVGAEVVKLLSAPDPAPAVAAMRQAGILARVLPGADDRALALLVDLEGDLPPDAMRRLAVLGGEDPSEPLRLSKAKSRALGHIRDESASAHTAAALGWRLGAGRARDVLLVRAALTGAPLPEGWQDAVARGAAAQFPIRAADLMPAHEGPALGARMRALEERWLASDLTLDRAALLG